MQFCEEEISWGELFEAFQNIYNKASEIEDATVLQGIALARVLKSDIEEFLSRIQTITLKAIVCEVLNHYELEQEVEVVEEFINTIYDNLESFESMIETLNNQDFNSISEIEHKIDPLFSQFMSEKEELESKIDAKLVDLFKPLTELGASEDQIRQALEEVEFADSPTQYILDVFLNIADQTIQNLD